MPARYVVMHSESFDCRFGKRGFLLWETGRTGFDFEDPSEFLFDLPQNIIFLRPFRPGSPVPNCATHLQWTGGTKPASPGDKTSAGSPLIQELPKILPAWNRDHSMPGSQFHPPYVE